MEARTFVVGFSFAAAVFTAAESAAFEAAAQVYESELIVTGRVVSVEPETDEATGETWNRAAVDVHEVWKGSPDGEEIAVRAPAGALANPGLALEGSARFQPGESVLLFLTRVGDEYRPWRTVFGKYAIQGNGPDARLVGNVPPLAEEIASSPAIALDEVRREVDVIVARESGAKPIDVARAD